MTNKKSNIKLSLSKISIANLGTLDQSDMLHIAGGSDVNSNNPTIVPINCQP